MADISCVFCTMLALEPLGCVSCGKLVCGACVEKSLKPLNHYTCINCDKGELVHNAFAKKWIARIQITCRMGCE